MVAQASSESGGEPPRGMSTIDAELLRTVAEIASKDTYSKEMQTLAKAMIGVIQMQAEMAQLLSQFMQLVSDESRKKAEE
jgi:hypothetical protein